MTFFQPARVVIAALLCGASWCNAQDATSVPTTGNTDAGPTQSTASSAATPTAPSTESTVAGQGPAGSQSKSSPTASSAQPIEGPDPSQVKHNGGKDDIDAIGNRKIGMRGFGNWYSLETDMKMGKSYSTQIEATSKLVKDPVITEYVNRIGQNIVRNSDAQVPFTFKVIDSDAINAFSLPGGFVYVNAGTILAADEEAELAGVMAHEIAHVCARHATRQMTRAQMAQFGSIALIFVGGGIGYALSQAAGFAVPMSFLAFQRGFEAEADYLGLEYHYKAGYDPQAFISFFEKIEAQEKQKPGSIAKAFSTHPQTPDRIAESRKEISTILPARPEYTVTTSDFDEVKARLQALENQRGMTGGGDKPTLRRPNAGNNTSADTGQSTTDDHPTLKRRSDTGDQQ